MDINASVGPGDRLELDTDTAVMTINGKETYKYSGSLISLEPNTNTLSYSDSEGSRTVELKVEYQERDV